MKAITIRTAHWHKDREQLLSIRKTVFVEEQQVPIEIEVDELDPVATHFLVQTEGETIGTGRVVINEPDHSAQVGRLAILAPWRKQGVGRQLLAFIETWLSNNSSISVIRLHAQVQSIPFYEKQHYSASGDVFLEAGIEHKTMQKQLGNLRSQGAGMTF